MKTNILFIVEDMCIEVGNNNVTVDGETFQGIEIIALNPNPTKKNLINNPTQLNIYTLDSVSIELDRELKDNVTINGSKNWKLQTINMNCDNQLIRIKRLQNHH